MSSTDKTRDKLVDSLRKSKSSPAQKRTAAKQKQAAARKAPAPAKRATDKAAPPQARPRAAAVPVTSDPYQARPRVWPD